jgi:hypothetical protein
VREEASVIISVRLKDDDLGTAADDRFVETLERAIREQLEVAPEIGYWDGHEFGGGWAAVFCYGKDGALLSDCVLGAILPFHSSCQLMPPTDGRTRGGFEADVASKRLRELDRGAEAGQNFDSRASTASASRTARVGD